MNRSHPLIQWVWVVLFYIVYIPVFSDLKKTSVLMEPAATYLGTHFMERIGFNLASAGDVNGDGYVDFMVGNMHSGFGDDTKWKDAGSVYLILGKSTGFQFNTSMNYVDAHFVGKDMYDHAGNSVTGRGDVNGDGLDDMLIGAAGGSQVPDNPGNAYLVFGRRSANWGHHFILKDSADASFYGEGPMSMAGSVVDVVGDINADGYDDFLISSPNYSLNPALDPKPLNGRVYLFKGKSSGWARGIPLASADAIFSGSNESILAGCSIAGVGDVNGDGIPDFAIGDVANAGKVYLIFGRRETNWGKNFNLNGADVIFTGGRAISRAGDVNADGCGDILISAGNLDNFRGKVYLILGKRSGWSSIHLSEADVSFSGENEGDQVGSAKGGGDFNGDGCSDIIIGASYVDNARGKVYLIKGQRTSWAKSISLGSISDCFYGQQAEDYAGFAVSLVGDLNQDGSCDFAVSAPYYGGEDYGKVYLFLGDRLCWKIKGQILYLGRASVSNVSVKVKVDSVACKSSIQGAYAVSAKKGKNYTLVPYKPCDEGVEDTVITSYDAALTARHAVGMDILSEDQKKAADANGDGKILMDDAVEIVRYGVGLKSNGVCRAGEWFFEPPSQVYSNIQEDKLNQNFRAFIRGDVDGNWSSNLAKNELQSISWNKQMNIHADTLEIAFYVETPVPLFSADVVLEYNEKTCQYLGTIHKEAGEKLRLFSSNQEGKLRVGGFTVEPMEGAELFTSIWRIKSNEGSENEIQLKRLQINNYRIAVDQVLWFGKLERELPKDFALNQNYPNPFNQSTVFELSLQKEEKMKVVLYNPNGEIVKMFWNNPLPRGKHVFHWDGKNTQGMELPSGVYLVQVIGERLKRSLKILLLK